MMKVATATPPNYETILKAFPFAAKPGVVFCYGDTIYNPTGIQLSLPIITHESIHSAQQQDTPDAWWERYIEDKQFRFEQELAAHSAELAAWRHDSRHFRRRALVQISEKLAAPLYGKLAKKKTVKPLLRTGAQFLIEHLSEAA